MSEFITIQVGQCGNQIGGTFWPLVLDEYGIKSIPDGVNRTIYNSNSKKSQQFELNDAFHSFFYVPDCKTQNIATFDDLKRAKIRARAVLIDMEESVVSKYSSGPYENLFCNKCIVTDYPGSGNNWAEGYFDYGRKHKENILNAIQRSAEKCDSLHGFLMMFSLGGGTGSGVGTYTLGLLEDHFPSVGRFVCGIYSSGTEDVIISPYNVAFATEQIVEHASCVFPIENRSLSQIVYTQKLEKSKDTQDYLLKCKPFQDMNSVVVNMLMHLTSGSRFSGSLNTDMSDLITNMVPYPQVQYLSSSYNPITVSSPSRTSVCRLTHEQLLNGILSPNNQLVKLDPLASGSSMLGVTLEGRGNLSLADMRKYVQRLQKKLKFTPWSQTAVKVGLCATPPAGHDNSLLALFNTTAMSSLFENVLMQLNQLYKRKAHVHHYTRVHGFHSDLFIECQVSLQNCIDRYEEMKQITPRCTNRLNIL